MSTSMRWILTMVLVGLVPLVGCKKSDKGRWVPVAPDLLSEPYDISNLGCSEGGSASNIGGGGGDGGGDGGGSGGPGAGPSPCGGFPNQGGVAGGLFFGGGVSENCGGRGSGGDDETLGGSSGNGLGELPGGGESPELPVDAGGLLEEEIPGGEGLPDEFDFDVIGDIEFDMSADALDIGDMEAGTGDPCCFTALCDEISPECPFVCGDGIVQPEFESCDGNCPTECEQPPRCDVVVSTELVGSEELCTRQCMPTDFRTCTDDDGCCPDGCNFINDNDCEEISGEIGSACNSDTDCGDAEAGYFCQLEGYRNGYCTYDFNRVFECPVGSHTGFGVLAYYGSGAPCLRDCETDADCDRPEYACFDADFDGQRECERAPEGPGEFGDPCTDTFECGTGPGAVCDLSRERCSFTCNGTEGELGDPEACPGDDLYCLVFTCIAECESCISGDGCCPRELGCTDELDADCEPVESAALGSPCTTDLDCGDGPGVLCMTQAQGLPGGYCSVDYTAVSECPEDTVPVTTGDVTSSPYCAEECASDADCPRDGYECYSGNRIDPEQLICFPVAEGAGDIGDSCDDITDCGTGQFGFCNSAGSCTRLCSDFGGPGGDCPAGTGCNFFAQCAEFCEDDGDCPPGHTCFPDLFGGGPGLCTPDA